MSKENAQQLLNAVMQDEKNVQDKVKKTNCKFKERSWIKTGNFLILANKKIN
mgnify:CR=1 FL=1